MPSNTDPSALVRELRNDAAMINAGASIGGWGTRDELTRWGNPYRVDRISDTEWAVVFLSRDYGALPIGAHETQAEALATVITAYRGLAEAGHFGPLDSLRGKDLACWCPLTDAEGNRVPCHADVLLEIANS